LLLVIVGLSTVGQAQSADSGTLHLTVGAGGKLSIDGRFVADLKPSMTYDSQPLKPGRHTIRLEMDGYLPVEEELVVRPGTKTARTLDQQSVIPIRPIVIEPKPPLQGQGSRVATQVVLANNEIFDFETHEKVKTGGDLMWLVIGDQGHLVGQRDARLTVLSKASSCENLSLDVLKAQSYSRRSIATGSGRDDLNTGTVIAALTRSGKYACARVDPIGHALTMNVTTFR
jgi:hypothetical protein